MSGGEQASGATPQQPTPNLCPHSPPPPPPHARTRRSPSHRPPLPAARPKHLLGLTWHTGTKLVWEFGDEVIVNSVLRRPQDDHRPRIVNCEHKPHCETRSALQEAPCKFISSWTCSKSFWSDPNDLCGQAKCCCECISSSPSLCLHEADPGEGAAPGQHCPPAHRGRCRGSHRSQISQAAPLPGA